MAQNIPDADFNSAAQRLRSRAAVESELDMIIKRIGQFWSYEPDHTMRECAAITARLTEMGVLLHRVETSDRQFRQLRTMQVDKLLIECDRQWKTASRLLEVRRQDITLTR